MSTTIWRTEDVSSSMAVHAGSLLHEATLDSRLDVLREVAQRIRATSRASDIAGRYGGEEFTLLLPDTDITGAVAVARVRAAASGRRSAWRSYKRATASPSRSRAKVSVHWRRRRASTSIRVSSSLS